MPTRLLKVLATVAAFAILLAGVPASVPTASALVTATMTIDGNMSDWTPVFMDSANTVADRSGTDDPDNPDGPSRDISQVAYTFDKDNLYVYMRRTTTGGPAMTFHVYIDVNANGWLDSQDMVLDIGSLSTIGLYHYVPSGGANATDTLGADGLDVPGTAGSQITTAVTAVAANTNGIEFEGRVNWAALAPASSSGSINLHFACGRNSPIPGSLTDNAANLTSRYRAVSLTPDHDAGTKPGTTIEYEHILTNSGNDTDTLLLTATTSQSGWGTRICDASGTIISAMTLGRNASAKVRVQVDVPAGTPYSTRGVTTVHAVSRYDAGVYADAYDETMVGLLTVSPYQQGAMAQEGTISFRHTVSNNTTSALAVTFSAQSSIGTWTAEIWNADGSSRLGATSLDPGATMTITCKVTVPPGTAVGTIEIATVKATAIDDSSIEGIAYDTLTVRKQIEVDPDQRAPAGPGTVISYTHTVTNSWSDTRTLTLSASSSQGWRPALYDQDGVTPLGTFELGPYGASRTIYCRITVPSTATLGMVDTTTILARAAETTVTDTAVDVTDVTNLATYDTAGYVVPATAFNPLDVVYARGMGLSVGQVQFQWCEPGTTTPTYTSQWIKVDVTKTCTTNYSLPSTATTGVWTLNMYSTGGVIGTTTFTVNPQNWLTLSIDTPQFDFGGVDPGVPTVPRMIGVRIESSAPYTITRETSGDTTATGFAVSGPAVGWKPKGIGTYYDSYQVDPPWSTDPQTPLQVGTVYTVVQD